MREGGAPCEVACDQSKIGFPPRGPPSAGNDVDIKFAVSDFCLPPPVPNDGAKHPSVVPARPGLQKVMGSLTVSETSGVSRVRPAPTETFRLRRSLRRYE